MEGIVEMPSSPLVTRKRMALHHQLSSTETLAADGDASSYYRDHECSDISSNASSTSTTLLDPDLGHVHYWNSNDPIDLVIHLQNNSHQQRRHNCSRSRRRSPTNQEEDNLHQELLEYSSFVDQAPLLVPSVPSSPHEEDDEYHLVLSTLHRFGMFDTPQRLRYWSSSPPDLPRVARTMLGFFIVALSFVAFCALVSSRYFSSTSARQMNPVIRMLRGTD